MYPKFFVKIYLPSSECIVTAFFCENQKKVPKLFCSQKKVPTFAMSKGNKPNDNGLATRSQGRAITGVHSRISTV